LRGIDPGLPVLGMNDGRQVPSDYGAGRESMRGKDDMLVGENRKGCDFGYALAANSCEGVTGVDACTVTAFEAITAFAVPNPG